MCTYCQLLMPHRQNSRGIGFLRNLPDGCSTRYLLARRLFPPLLETFGHFQASAFLSE